MTDNNPRSLDELAADVLPQVKQYFIKYLSIDMNTALELTHDTWIRASKVLYTPRTSFSSNLGQYKCIWIAAKWVYLDFLKKEARNLKEIPIHSDLEFIIDDIDTTDNESINAIISFIETLLPRDQIIILSRYFKGLSYKKIGEMVGLAEDNIRYHLKIIEEKIRRNVFSIHKSEFTKSKKTKSRRSSRK